MKKMKNMKKAASLAAAMCLVGVPLMGVTAQEAQAADATVDASTLTPIEGIDNLNYWVGNYHAGITKNITCQDVDGNPSYAVGTICEVSFTITNESKISGENGTYTDISISSRELGLERQPLTASLPVGESVSYKTEMTIKDPAEGKHSDFYAYINYTDKLGSEHTASDYTNFHVSTMRGFQDLITNHYFRYDGQLWRRGYGVDLEWINNMTGLEDPKIYGWDQTAYEQNPTGYQPLRQPIFNVGDSKFYQISYTNREDVPVRLEGKWDYGRVHTLGSCGGLVVQPGENVKCYVEEVLTQEDIDWGEKFGSRMIFYVTYDVGGASEHKVFTAASSDSGAYLGAPTSNIHIDSYIESVAAVNPNLTDGENSAFTYTVNYQGNKTYLPNSKVFYSNDNRVYEMGDLTINNQNRLNSITVTNIEPKAVNPYYYCAEWAEPDPGEIILPPIPEPECLRTERAIKEASIFIKTYFKGLYHSAGMTRAASPQAYSKVYTQDQNFNVEVTTQGEDAATVDISTDYVPQNGWSVEIAEASSNTQVETKTLPGDTKTLDVSSLEAGTEYVATVVNADSRERKTATFVTAAATPGGGTTPGDTTPGGGTTPSDPSKPQDVVVTPAKPTITDKPGYKDDVVVAPANNARIAYKLVYSQKTGKWTLTATAAEGYVFADGTTTNVQTGQLDVVVPDKRTGPAPKDPTDPQIPDEIVTGEVAEDTEEVNGFDAGVLGGVLAALSVGLGLGLGFLIRRRING